MVNCWNDQIITAFILSITNPIVYVLVNIPSNRLFRLQVASHIVLVLIAVLDIAVRHLLFGHEFYG